MPVETKMLAKSRCAANSPAWSSPEVLSYKNYSFSSDVYSFGVLMWAMLTLKEPWKEECNVATYCYGILYCGDVPLSVKVGFIQAYSHYFLNYDLAFMISDILLY